MNTTRRWSLLALLLVPLTLLALAPGTAQAAPASEARSAELELADECTSCGKRIYFGERCLTCIAKQKREAASHPCTGCEKPILIGELCAACVWRAGRDKLAHPCADCATEVLVGARCASCSAKHLDKTLGALLERSKASGAGLAPAAKARLDALLRKDQDAAEREAEEAARGAAWKRYAATATAWAKDSGRAIAAKTEDLPLKEKASAAVGAALQVATSIETTKRNLADAGLGRIGSIPVTSELGRTSLEDLCSFKLLELAPELEGSDLVEDPSAVLASLIVADHMYFLMDLELVEGPDGPLTIVEALEAKSGNDPSGALACLTILESVDRLRHGQDLTRAMRDISRSLDVLNPSLQTDDEAEGDAEAEPAEEPAPEPER